MANNEKENKWQHMCIRNQFYEISAAMERWTLYLPNIYTLIIPLLLEHELVSLMHLHQNIQHYTTHKTDQQVFQIKQQNTLFAPAIRTTDLMFLNSALFN